MSFPRRLGLQTTTRVEGKGAYPACLGRRDAHAPIARRVALHALGSAGNINRERIYEKKR